MSVKCHDTRKKVDAPKLSVTYSLPQKTDKAPTEISNSYLSYYRISRCVKLSSGAFPYNFTFM